MPRRSCSEVRALVNERYGQPGVDLLHEAIAQPVPMEIVTARAAAVRRRRLVDAMPGSSRARKTPTARLTSPEPGRGTAP